MRAPIVRAALFVIACLIVSAATASAQSWPDPVVGGSAHPITGDPAAPAQPSLGWTAKLFLAMGEGTPQYAVPNAPWIRSLAIRAAARVAPPQGQAFGRTARTYRALPAAGR